jgi:hypothetical protein
VFGKSENKSANKLFFFTQCVSVPNPFSGQACSLLWRTRTHMDGVKMARLTAG